MKSPVPIKCNSCGHDFQAVGNAGERFDPVTCPKCDTQIHILDHLSISVVADRLLLRSRIEIDSSDYTLGIICSAMAVECALTQVFMKWKALEQLKSKGNWGTENERYDWEKEYRKESSAGGFANSANFVSKYLCGRTFDDFVAEFLRRSNGAALIRAGFPRNESEAKGAYVHRELFHRRNRIMHWGEVKYQLEEASLALKAARTAVAVLKVIDREKYEAEEKARRESINQPPVD